MVRDDELCLSQWRSIHRSDVSLDHGVSCANVESLLASCSLSEDSPFLTCGTLQESEFDGFAAALSDQHLVLCPSTSGPEFNTAPSLDTFAESPAGLGPYGVFWPSQSSGPGSLGQFSTFSAQDGSQKSVSYVPLSTQGSEPWGIGFDSDSLYLSPAETSFNIQSRTTLDPRVHLTSNQYLPTSGSTGSSQLVFPATYDVFEVSSDVNSSAYVGHMLQSPVTHSTSSSHQCQNCARSFTRRSLLK